MTPRRVEPLREPATLVAMDEVMQRAYGAGSFRSSIDRFVAAQRDGLVVVERDGRVAGCGCCIAYRDAGFGWIGLVATDPPYQRLGIATTVTEALSEILAAHGCASVLDASAAGAPVYERMGFVDTGVTDVLSWEPKPTAGVCEVPAHGRARSSQTQLVGGDLDAVIGYDAQRFGAERSTLLRTLLAQQPGRAFMTTRDGDVVGYAVAQDGTLGPLIADDRDALVALVQEATALSWSVPPRINVPHESLHRSTLLELGFAPRRQLRHMHRGIGALPGRRACVAGMVSLGEG